MAEADERAARRVVNTTPGYVGWEEYTCPAPGREQLRLQTLCTTISTGTELTLINREFPETSNWARYADGGDSLGYSSCALVEAAGPEVEGYAVGDCVLAYAPHADWSLAEAKRLLGKVPAGMDPKLASTIALGLIAMNGLRRARLEFGECVVVYGLGVLGLLVVQMARLSGCRPVSGVDLSPLRRALAERVGATRAIDGPDVPHQVHTLNGGRGADVLFEVTGNPAIIQDEFRVLRHSGRAVILSSPRGPSTFDFHDFCNGPCFTIIGAHNMATPAVETTFSAWTWARNGELYLRLIGDGELKVAELITEVAPAERAVDVYDRLIADRGELGVVVLDWRR